MGVFTKIGDLLKSTQKEVIDQKNTFKNDLPRDYLPSNWHFKRITDELLASYGFATNADVYAMISMIAFKSSEIPINFLRPNYKGEQVIDTSSDAYGLLYEDKEQGYKSKIIEMMTNILTTGDLYIEKVNSFSGSTPERLSVLRSASVKTELNANGDTIALMYCENSKYRRIDYDNVIHIELYDPLYNPYNKGLSPLQAGYQVLTASNDLQLAASSLYKNQGSSVLLSDNSGSMNGDDESKDLQRALNSRIGGAGKAGQVTVTSADVALHNLGMSSRDLELIKSQPIKLRQMCNIYGVDSSFFNDPDNKTYNNRKTAEKALINNGVKPKFELIIEGIERDFRKAENVSLEFDYSGLDCLQEDQRERAEKDVIVSNGIIGVLQSGLLPAQQIQVLVDVWGYTIEDAKKIVF